MRKLKIANVLVALMIVLSAVSYIKTTIGYAKKYGWTYNRTITVNGNTHIEVIACNVEIVGGVFTAIVGFLLLYNVSSLPGKTPTYDEASTDGIQFPLGEPEKWDIQYDRRNKRVAVFINGITVTFPLEMITNWEGEE